MLSLPPYFHDARCLILVPMVLSAYLPFVFSSNQEIQLEAGNRERRYPSVQLALAIPTVLSEELLISPARGSVDPSYSSSQQLEEVPQDSDPYTSDPHLSHSELHDSWHSSSPASSVTELAVNEEVSDALLVMAYYPDWLGSTFPPSKIDFDRFHWLDFAFAVPDSDMTLKWDDPGAPELLTELVTAAHNTSTKVKLSIGGWTGSKYFSSAVASHASRSTFVDNIAKTYYSFELDGIDIDWEYPGKKGDSGDHFHSTDSANFLSFLQLLRAKLPPNAVISAAVETTTFASNNGEPMTDLSEFAKVLDWVLIMNYDVWGSSGNPGPNAPLHDACNNSTQPDANAVAAYDAWTSANFPANKLVLGLPSYGYLSSSTAERLRTRSMSPSSEGDGAGFITAVSEDGGSDDQVQFRNLIEQGILVRSAGSSIDSSSPKFVGSGGFERSWDDCSDTPFLRSASSGQVISYDDPESLAMKAAFSKGVGMRGINLFDVHGDTDEWDLTDSVRKSLI